MAAPYGLTAGGYIAPRALDFLAVIRARFEQDRNDGNPYDWDADQVLGVLTAIQALQLGDISEGAVQSLADALDLNNASGHLLDILVQCYGLSRRQPTVGSALLTPTLSATPAFVPGGTRFGQIVDATTIRVWEAAEDTTLTGAPGETILVRCAEAGSLTAGIGAINRILDGVPNLSSVTNAASATPGLGEQSDQDLRLDALRLLQAPSRGTLGALYAAVVRATPAGTFVGVIENTSVVSITVDGVTVPPIGTVTVIHPTLTAAEEQMVREAIFQTKPLGGSVGGSETGTVVGPDGNPVTIPFEYANESSVTVAVVTTRAAGFDLADVEEGVQAAVETYFARLRVGDDVLRLGLAALIAGVTGVTGATITLNGSGADLAIGPATIATLAAPATVS